MAINKKVKGSQLREAYSKDRGACSILWPMVGNFFGDQAAGVLQMQMKYKRMIFFLILEMPVTSNVFEMTPWGLIDLW